VCRFLVVYSFSHESPNRADMPIVVTVVVPKMPVAPRGPRPAAPTLCKVANIPPATVDPP